MQEENVQVVCKACTLLQTEGKFTKENKSWRIVVDLYHMLSSCGMYVSVFHNNEYPLFFVLYF